MLKYLFAVFIFCFFSIFSVESWNDSAIFEGNDSELAIEFDDFPNNSTPDLESLFEDSPAIVAKEFKDFSEVPDSADTIDQQSEFALDFHAFPSTVVNGCVNVMSGDYQEATVDFSLPGSLPLELQRYYCGSRKCEKYSFLYGWQLTHGAKLLFYKSKHNHDNAILKGGDRHGIHFKGDRHDRIFSCNESLFKNCMTNCSFGEISAKNNVKNDLLYKYHEAFDLVTADQTCYAFAKSSHDPEREHNTHGYRLEKVHFPKGHSYQYSYGQTFGMPISIQLLNRNGTEIAGLKLQTNPSQYQFLRHPELTYLTSTGEKIGYRFMLYGDHYRAILTEVTPPHSPKIKYSYGLIGGHYKQKRVRKRELPDNRVLEITYDKNDKVKELLSPAGEGNALIATHTFNYYKDGNTRFAEVKNALGEKKRYSWNKHRKRLNTLRTFDQDGNLILKERFRWGDSRNDQSHLTGRIVEEGNGKLIAFQKYRYDQWGNIACSYLYGDFTGKSTPDVYIDNNLKTPPPGSCEVFKKHYTYDEKKRRISEDDGRTVNRFAYFEDTDLVSAQYTCYDGRIQLRRFFSYDVSGAIYKEVSDDGSAELRSDLSDVSERLIKLTKNTATGLPEITKEYAVDLASRQKNLLRKTVNQYDQHGWMVAQTLYDSAKNVVCTLEWNYDSHGNVVLEKDALGYVTRSKYDANDNLIYEEKTDTAAKILTYDCMNRLTSETQVASNDQLHKSYKCDAMGNCISSTDIYGNKTHHDYDAHGRLIKTTFPTVPGMEAKPNITYNRNSIGLATTMTDANGYLLSIEYNLRGKPTCTIYPDGTSERQIYTLWGDLAETTSRDGTKIQYAYDPLGREIKKEWFDKEGMLLKTTSKTYNALHLLSETDGNGVETHYTYDAAGRLASEKTLEKVTTYAYDTLGRKTSTTCASVSTVELYDAADQVIETYTLHSNGEISNRVLKNYDAQGHEVLHQEWNQAGCAITKTEYDPFGRVTCVTNPLGEAIHTTYHHGKAPRQEVTDSLGVKTSTTYDPFGHPVLEQRYDPMGELVEEVKYGYDLNGNKVLRLVTTEEDPIETRWSYDSLNQLKETTEAVGTKDQKRVERRYDDAGRIKTLIKNDDIKLNYEYDALGRRTSMKSSDGSIHYTYKYDQNDNLLQAIDKIQGTTLSRTYDGHNQLTSDTLPYGHTISYAYDSAGHIQEITLPDQTEISYEREGSKLRAVKRKGVLSYTHTYTSHDASLNPTEISFAANSGTLKLDYDLLHRPKAIQTNKWQEKLEFEAHLLKKRHLKDAFGKNTSNYTYDAKDQILSENGTATHQLEYDWQGNPIRYDGHSRKFNKCNALLKDKNHRYTYDKNGNRTSDGVNIYSYDALDRLIKVETPSGVYHYVYDALGRRVARINQDKTTYFLCQEEQEIGTISPSGVIEELQILNPANHAIALELQGTLYVPLHDIFGHVRALLDSEGNCVATYRYSAFGEEQIQGTVLSPWRYAGKRIDEETGFIYFGERYYDPSTLCWLTPDPMEDADGPNLYAYVHNNPLFFVDPDGCLSMDWLNSGWGTGAAIFANVALMASGVGAGFCGITEGFLSGCAGGISGAAIDLALDATTLYGEGGLSAACATATSSTISYNVCKTIGCVAGAAFSCTPAGKAAQVGLNVAKLGVDTIKTAKTAAQVAKTANKVKNASVIGANGAKVANATTTSQKLITCTSSSKLLGFSPVIIEGNANKGLIHIMKRHASESNAKNASKFISGIGKKEISELVNKACMNAKEWEVGINGFHSAIVDVGKVIGTKRDCGSRTSLIRVVLNKNNLHTAHPF